jgi:exodeoxyribonuclease V gamma subunit
MQGRQLRIITGNRLGALMRAMGDSLSAAPLPPLAPEVIVVQSQGMRRWVTLQLADRLGCAASLHMPFPGAFCHHLSERLAAGAGARAGERYEDSPFGRDAMAWRIDAALDGLVRRPEFAPIRAYLSDNDARKRHEFCARVANLFDDYQVYRTEMLLAWEADPPPKEEGDAAWQAELWRRLTRGVEEEHLARRFERLIGDLERRSDPPKGLPARMAVFGVTTLPPVFIRLMWAMARFVPVAMYVVTADDGQRTTGDGRPGTDGGRAATKRRVNTPLSSSRPLTPDPRHRTPVSHPLSESMGGQGAAFMRSLQKTVTDEGAWERLDAAMPPRDSLLHDAQADVLEGVARGPGQALPLREGDDSLTVHLCHSPMREMEVLRDRLLAAFEADPELRPHDVLVMMPDVTAYAPYIRSVFDVERAEAPRLPVRVADRRVAQEMPLTELFRRVLSLAEGRFAATEVLDLLECPAVRRQAGFTESDLSTLAAWVRAAGIRWGVDARAKEAAGLPPEAANTWRAGLDRLLMGYAVGGEEDLVAGTLPHAGATTGRAEALGRFVDWCERLFARVERLKRERTLREWAAELAPLPAEFFDPQEDAEQDAVARIRAETRRLDELAALSGHARPVPPGVLNDHFERAFADDGFGTGFISGSITFCAMKPMRTIPFKVIAICGLDHDAFPRRDRPPAFDLQARAPRDGDRSLRADDRQLFLESLLAAERRLIVTYVGRSQRDNSPCPPSVCLAELLDHVDRAFVAGARDAVVIEHPLQPFSRRYYDGSDPRLFSYSAENCRAGRAAAGQRRPQAPFVAGAFAPPEGALALTTADVVRCWTNPSRFLCERVLEIRYGGEEEGVDDIEPLALDALTTARLADWLVERRLKRGRAEDEAETLAARGDLPPAQLGRAVQFRLEDQAAPVLRYVAEAGFLPPADLTAQGKDWTLTGHVDGLTAQARLQYRCATVKPKDFVRAWVTHLLLNAAAERDGALPRVTQLIGRDAAWRFEPVQAPAEQLDRLMAACRRALTGPVPFFEGASYAFATRMRKPGKSDNPVESAWREAHAAWHGNRFMRTAGDGDDPFVALCFRGCNPLRDRREEFESLALEFWGPLLDHAQEEAP